jgi:transcriptional regulator with XRE-family HTH domain
MTLQELLPQLRSEKGWNYSRLWRESGVHISTIRLIEKGETRAPSAAVLHRLAVAFGRDVQVFLDAAAERVRAGDDPGPREVGPAPLPFPAGASTGSDGRRRGRGGLAGGDREPGVAEAEPPPWFLGFAEALDGRLRRLEARVGLEPMGRDPEPEGMAERGGFEPPLERWGPRTVKASNRSIRQTEQAPSLHEWAA